MNLLTIILSIVASGTLDVSGKVYVRFIEIKTVKNKVFINNYTIITCAFIKKRNSISLLVE